VGGVFFLGASILLLPERTQGHDPGEDVAAEVLAPRAVAA
jgi:hypothetical protein